MKAEVTEVAEVLQRAQRRIQGLLADAKRNAARTSESIDNLTEERDALSRISAAIRGLTRDHLSTLAKHTADYGAGDELRYAKIMALVRVIVASPTPEHDNG